ncbi:MAG: hypothetical protein CMJ78_26955 [Planctomycetaceae bacterium]|nr:hypothetical protein [Planctomycetaceae bacterium]
MSDSIAKRNRWLFFLGAFDSYRPTTKQENFRTNTRSVRQFGVPIAALLICLSFAETADAQIFFGSRPYGYPYYGRRSSGFSFSFGSGYRYYPRSFYRGYRGFGDGYPYGYHMNLYRDPFGFRRGFYYGPQIYIQRSPSVRVPTQQVPAERQVSAQPLFVQVASNGSVFAPVPIQVPKEEATNQTPEPAAPAQGGETNFPEKPPEPKIIDPSDAAPIEDGTSSTLKLPEPDKKSAAPTPEEKPTEVVQIPQAVGSLVASGNAHFIYSTNPESPALKAAGKGASIHILHPIAPRDFARYFSPSGGTHLFAFVHPRTGHTVAVQLALPAGRPKMDIETREIELDYGRYEVEIDFERDGSVDIDYDD